MPTEQQPTPPMPGTVIPLNRLRWKGDVLQAAYGGTSGRGVWWVPVPTVADDAPDYQER